LHNHFTKQLVLIGAGHANVQVLKKLCMNQFLGLHTILINDGINAIYSGMTPGFIQNQYSQNEISINLQRLCLNAEVTFINDKVVGLDTENKFIKLKKAPKIEYDYLSINCGSISKTFDMEIKDVKNTISAKPISNLVQKIKNLDELAENHISKFTISIIGAGIAAFELALSLNERYRGKVLIKIIGSSILAEANINNLTRRLLKKICSNNKIEIIQARINKINTDYLETVNALKIKSDFNIICSGADIAKWLKTANLEINQSNCLIANQNLLSTKDDSIFLSGDLVDIKNFSRSKSGVMAVRQGEVLKENIFLKIKNQPLKKFYPQKNWLYLVTTKKETAVLNYYFLSLKGKWCWDLKNWIDKRFMKKFIFTNSLMKEKKIFNLDTAVKNQKKIMYCQGCGSKVSKNNLINYLNSLTTSSDLPDSSIIDLKTDKILQTIDLIKHFSSFSPFDFGRISYFHSQNDILAGGGKVHSLSISVGIPFSTNKVEKFYLSHFIEGIKQEATYDNAIISAGHSYQTDEPATTITMNGTFASLTSKSNAKINDLIYLSKPLGTGYLLSANYQNCKLLGSQELEQLLFWLSLSNKSAANIALENNCNAMTDISGFGLASHLGDICMSSNVSADLHLTEEILINKNLEILKDFKSTGFDNNMNAMKQYVSISNNSNFEKILYDPQTNGAMLMIINPDQRLNFENRFFNECGYAPLLIGKFTDLKNKIINCN